MPENCIHRTGPAHRASRFRSGFTITELLVAVAVVAILTTILFTALNSSTDRVQQTQCVSNLRSIGVAVLTYVSDRSGRLPGPAPGGITAGYQEGNFANPTHLSHHLLPYMEAVHPADSRQIVLLSAFVCPASMPHLNASDKQWGKTYSQVPSRVRGTPNITDSDGALLYPFGYKAGDPETWRDAPLLSEIKRPSDTFAVLDRSNPAPGVSSGHGKHRNILFLDGHVRSVPLTDFISISELRY